MHEHQTTRTVTVAAVFAVAATCALAATAAHAQLSPPPLYVKAIKGAPEPVSVIDGAGFPHVVYYESLRATQPSEVEFSLVYTYYDGNAAHSARIPATGSFSAKCVVGARARCDPHLSAPTLVLDTQGQAHVALIGNALYDYIAGTSMADILDTTCPAGASCSTPFVVSVFDALCLPGAPGGTCPPKPPRLLLGLANDRLTLGYGASVSVGVQTTTIDRVQVQRPALGGSWHQVLAYSTVIENVPPAPDTD